MPVDIFVTLHHPSAQGPAQSLATTSDITFEAKSFTWGADNLTSIGAAPVGAGAGKAKFSEATLTKLADASASPLLFQLLTTGGHFDTVTVELRKAGGAPEAGGPNQPASTRISLHAVFVTHLDQSVTEGDESLQEVVHLAYGSVQLTINSTDPTGKMLAGKPVSWNQVTNNDNLVIPGMPS